MKKRFMAILLCLALFAPVLAGAAAASEDPAGDDPPFAGQDGFQEINGTWYCFTETGEKYIGWVECEGGWYYFGYSGLYRSNFAPISGEAGTEPVTVCDSSGRSDRQPYTGWYVVPDLFYRYYKDGYRYAGWLEENGNRYYFDEDFRQMAYSCCLNIDGTPYVFTDSGALSTGGWQYGVFKSTDNVRDNADDHWYYADSDGVARTGWLEDGGNLYYLDPEHNGRMVVGWAEIDGIRYYFGEDGALIPDTPDEPPVVTVAEDGRSAQITGSYAGLYARVALVLDNRGESGLFIVQGRITDGVVEIPLFDVPGLTITGVSVALVRNTTDIPSSHPDVVAMGYRFLDA